MGALDHPVTDGTPGKANPFSQALAAVTVLVGGKPGVVSFDGLSTQFPGLYQINVQLPTDLPVSGNLPLALETPNAFHDQVYIPMMVQ